MIKKTPKLSKAAREWIRPSLYYSLYDCCDSMHEAEKLENRFAALAGDKIGVEEYTFKYHMNEYIDCIKQVAKENGDGEEIENNWKEFLKSTPTQTSDEVINYFETRNKNE